MAVIKYLYNWSRLVKMAKKRLSDKEFWTILRENAGLYARTARAIQREYGMGYTRQAVRDRASKKPEMLADIFEENIDLAEEGLHSLMRSKNERVRQKAIEFYLKTRGKERGYVVQVNSDITSGGEVLDFKHFLMTSSIIEDGDEN